MWEDFQKELYGRETIKDTKGFITFTPLNDGSVYLHSIYIKPEHRKSNAGTKLLNTVIEVTNAHSLSSYVDTTAKNPELSILAHLKAGFSIDKTNEHSIIFYKKVRDNG